MVSYADMAQRASMDNAYRDGLLDAARIAKAQGQDPNIPPCPSSMAALYIERVAAGETP